MNIDPRDGGYRSRKFWVAVLALVLLAVVAVAAQRIPALVGLYPTFVGGVCGVITAYFAGNIAHKHVASKSATAPAQTEAEAVAAAVAEAEQSPT